MNFTSHATLGSQENIFGGGALDGSRMPRTKQRTVLGVLSENEQQSRAVCLGASKHRSLDEAPSFGILAQACTSNFSFDVRLEDTSEIVLTSTGSTVSERTSHEHDVPLQHEDFHLVLDQSSGSCMETSMQDLFEYEPLSSQEALAVDEYAEEIHQHLRQAELKFRPKPGYMSKQPDITNWMRIILIDWLVEVGEEYKLSAETIFLAVNYLDRFLSSMSVLRGKLQLVGTAAILLAAKYEEVYPPEVDEFVYITDDTYTKKQLLRMEHLLLKVLGFDLTMPTTHQFLILYITLEPVSANTAHLALFLAELSLLEVDPFLRHLPSQVAAASYCLANYTLNKAFWPDHLYAFTGYTLAEIVPCLKDLHKLHQTAANRPQQAIREKYKTPRNGAVSLITALDSLPFQ
ncbi:cyclin-A1 [Clupea harengus]|uniref:Cyclin-A1 n=1 Tax=Clupea harengus TaxID=7950 RepID=A0A6P3VQS1_CLUHA|nr:cyclin-A1 [Clupea harengus]